MFGNGGCPERCQPRRHNNKMWGYRKNVRVHQLVESCRWTHEPPCLRVASAVIPWCFMYSVQVGTGAQTCLTWPLSLYRSSSMMSCCDSCNSATFQSNTVHAKTHSFCFLSAVCLCVCVCVCWSAFFFYCCALHPLTHKRLITVKNKFRSCYDKLFWTLVYILVLVYHFMITVFSGCVIVGVCSRFQQWLQVC